MNNAKVLHVYSGGLDSTVLLYQLLEADNNDVECINFHYGSNHNISERRSAERICRGLGIELMQISLDFIPKYFKSSLLSGSDAIPEGAYDGENMRSTVVPFRNAIMLSIATGVAESKDMDVISIAAHAGDHYIYPDCRPAFLDSMQDAIREGTQKGIQLHAPFYNIDKAEIIRIGSTLGVPLGNTYSCYKGGLYHCGKCGACDERKASFAKAGVTDSTMYRE